MIGVLPCSGEILTFLVVDVLFSSSLSLDDDEMDTRDQDIFIIDKQPIRMEHGQTNERREADEEDEDASDNSVVEHIDEDESVTACKSANVGNKNKGQNEGEESSEDSEDEDDIMEMSTFPPKSAVPARCITASIR